MLKKNDFIELEFTGKVKDGEIFDTNVKDKAKELNLELDAKPFILCIGQNMILPPLDKDLEGKEIGKHYSIEIKAKEACGLRDKNLVKTIPLRVFLEQKINPYPGLVLNMDGMIVRIAAVSGGRVIADFNNPLAGKDVVYDFKILKKIETLDEKIKAIMSFLLRKEFEFKVEGNKLTIEASEPEQKYISLFKDKFKEMLDLDLDFKLHEHKKEKEEKAEKKEEKKASKDEKA